MTAQQMRLRQAEREFREELREARLAALAMWRCDHDNDEERQQARDERHRIYGL